MSALYLMEHPVHGRMQVTAKKRQEYLDNGFTEISSSNTPDPEIKAKTQEESVPASAKKPVTRKSKK